MQCERERPNRAEVRWWFSFVYYCHLHICHRHFFVALAEHGKFRACALNIYQRYFSFREARHIDLSPLHAYCIIIARTVSRSAKRYLPYAFSCGPPGSWHAAVSARAILAYFQVAPSNHEDLEAVQRRSVTEGCRACRRMEESSRAG